MSVTFAVSSFLACVRGVLLSVKNHQATATLTGSFVFFGYAQQAVIELKHGAVRDNHLFMLRLKGAGEEVPWIFYLAAKQIHKAVHFVTGSASLRCKLSKR